MMKKTTIKTWAFSVFAFLCMGVANVSNHGLRMLQKPEVKTSTAKFKYNQNSIVASVYINDEGPYNFFVDTGIYPSQISLQLAKKLELKLGKSGGNVLGFGSKNIPFYPTTIERLKIGDLLVMDLEAISSDMSHFEESGVDVDGILGYSFLKDRITSIDYKDENLTFYTSLPDDFLSGKSANTYVKFPLKLAGGKIPTIPNLTIKGKKVSAWLDTGANVAIGLKDNDARRLDLKEVNLPNAKVSASGARGKFSIKLVHVEDMSIGIFSKDSVLGFTHNQGMHNAVGNAFFDDYLLTLDYVNRMVYLESNE